MRRSKRWNDLKREIGTLRKHFLPNQFDPLGLYRSPTRVQAHVRAFVVLSHAEIESYIEGWAKEISRAAETVWTSSGKITEPLAYLLVTLSQRIEVPEKLIGSKGKDSPKRLIDAAVKLFEKYYKRIRDNNGITAR